MSEHEFGRYTGKLILEPAQGGQQMKITLDFGFLDADGKHWPVPSGTSVDGASMPKALWTLLGGRWEGKCREASVVHDYHCAVHSADWQSVHRMFYRAIRASGLSEKGAKLVYAGIYFAGPRWEDMACASVQVNRLSVPTQAAPGNVLYALARDSIALAVSEAIACDGTTAFNWIASDRHPTDRNSEITLGLDKLSDMLEEDSPSLRSLEAAIDYSVSLIPSIEGSSRKITIGRLAMVD